MCVFILVICQNYFEKANLLLDFLVERACYHDYGVIKGFQFSLDSTRLVLK